MRVQSAVLPRAATRSVAAPARALEVEARAPQVRLAPEPQRDPRAERIEHWLRGVQEKTLWGLRSASSAYAGQMVGMAVGAALSAPLAVATGNVFVFFGGSALLGCAGAFTAYRWDRKNAEKPVAESPLLEAGMALKAVPDFIYPSIAGATTADRAVIMETLDRLPMGSVTSVSSIGVLPGLENANVSGVALPAFSQNQIYVDRSSLHSWGNWGRELVAHEVGHARDFERTGLGVFGARSLLGPFGREPFVSWYAGSNRLEDFAETHAVYHTGDRAVLQAVNPGKFAELERLQRPGLGEEWASQPGVRNAGRELGGALETVPYLRQALELAGGLIAPLQLRRGARKLEAGFLQGDDAQKFQGKMALASGLMLLSPAGPAGALLTSATSGVLNGLVSDGKLSLAQANRIGNGAVAVASGPIGMVGSAVCAELTAGGVDFSHVAYRPGEHATGHPDASSGDGVPWTLGGISVGLFVGATVGSFLGGVGGAFTGMLWGPLAGGAAGLAAYHLRKPPSVPGKLDLTGSDKAFLGRVIGCGAAGGVLGSLVGARLGAAAGAAVGGALLGPAGAVTGEFVGRFTGTMLGSLALGRAGAYAGRRWDEAAG